MRTFYAHTRPDNSPLPESSKDDWQLLKDHLEGVVRETNRRVIWGNEESEVNLAGCLHDLGKYSQNFQKRLEGKVRGVNHWSQGAYWAAKQGAMFAAFAIYGHHQGIGIPSAAMLQALLQNPPGEQKLWNISETLEELKKIAEAEGITIPGCDRRKAEEYLSQKCRFTIAVRMLFSALCDGDVIDTEAHFSKYSPQPVRPQPLPLEPPKSLRLLLEYLDQKPKPTKPEEKVVYENRQKLLSDCLKAAEEDQGLFTLTAPTGSGKTLASLAFALRHAEAHQLRRVIVVIPYLSIIDQNAREFKQLFEPTYGPGYVLEHHSMADRSQTKEHDEEGEHQDDEKIERQRCLLAETWDAPLVVTTSVQFFESLFANQSTACRKLHNIAKSIIYFDEVQILPGALVRSILESLNVLVKDYRVTVIFGTATQPAFKRLSEVIEGGWRPREITQNSKEMFESLRRVNPRWPKTKEDTMDWPEVAEALLKHPQAMCIVNLKKHAAALVKCLSDGLAKDEREAVCHLSTALCPAHRQVMLQKVLNRLEKKDNVYLVATQCIEAGVDIDFPVVWRAMGPLDSLTQAFGRCNREGRLTSAECEARIFIPHDGDIPMPGYGQATNVATAYFWREDLQSPEAYERYFAKLYDIQDLAGQGGELQQKLREAVEQLDFPKMAKYFRLIEPNTISAVVKYEKEGERLWKALHSVIGNQKALHALWREAQPYVVNIYRSQLRNKEISKDLEPILGDKGGEWWLWKGVYDDHLLGILGKLSPDDLVV